MAFLTILVATHGNGFRVSEPLSRSSHLPPVATGCDALLHKRSILLGRRRAGRAARSRRFHHCSGARSRVPPPRIPSGAADRPRAKRSSRFDHRGDGTPEVALVLAFPVLE